MSQENSQSLDPAYQIHAHMENIDYKRLSAFFNRFMREKTRKTTVTIHGIGENEVPFGEYIYATITDMLDKTFSDTDNNHNDEYVLYSNGFETLMSQIESLFKPPMRISEDLLRIMFYSLEYAKRQPKRFRMSYLKAFINDCYTYGDEKQEADNLTCPKGALERITFCLAEACAIAIEKEENNNIMEMANATPKAKKTLLYKFFNFIRRRGSIKSNHKSVTTIKNTNKSKMIEYRLLGSIISTQDIKESISNHASVWFKSGVGKNIVAAADRKQAFVEYIELKVNETIELDDTIRHEIKTYSDSVDFDELFGGSGRRMKKNRRRTEKKKKISRKMS